ncbi:phosphate ABC transporter permease [Candidatus Amesbacteria bacterium RIFCSPLOWO2_01_FULL_49_25]|uniref:Transport permease protein n=1 Tax=Candidatus Amesbacteria bacterium RIFCSPHIGHO2_01_FULL_48_32b TaxID=1797253 RepID=A0A1F4YDX5_9BACT|nr:MAG: phosphate ABC transporter permease [Candidatus Amesbacteria bacterium RIFCSPHIGHO2_01_FULL_48_32b]OGD08086.1 MAG: phosphate ABC transporter permease [Candidatus Amesbacteria bacterium RIFCSPLOWO2_01_FULL_49_25]
MKNYTVIIKPESSLALNLSEIWRYRELFLTFAWRDIKVRYKQTVLGVAWAILQPVSSMVVFTVFFGNLAKIPSGNLPYSLFVLCGLVFWGFFSTSLSHASDSLVGNESIIKKVYFPKVILPLSAIVVSFIDFLINFSILMIYAVILGYYPSIWTLVIIPIAVIVTALSACGIGLFLSAFNIRYRDVRYILPFFIQVIMFLTPVIYPLSIVGLQKRAIMAINPMTMVIESVRQVFSDNPLIDTNLISISLISIVACLIFGLWYFKKTERFFADIV